MPEMRISSYSYASHSYAIDQWILITVLISLAKLCASATSGFGNFWSTMESSLLNAAPWLYFHHLEAVLP